MSWRCRAPLLQEQQWSEPHAVHAHPLCLAGTGACPHTGLLGLDRDTTVLRFGAGEQEEEEEEEEAEGALMWSGLAAGKK